MSGPVLTYTDVPYASLQVRGIISDPPPDESSWASTGDIVRTYTSPSTDFATISRYRSYAGTPAISGAPYPNGPTFKATFTLPAAADDVGARVTVIMFAEITYPYAYGALNLVMTSSFGTTRTPAEQGFPYYTLNGVSQDFPSPGSGATVTAYCAVEESPGGVYGVGPGSLNVVKPVCSVYVPAPEVAGAFGASGLGPQVVNSVTFASTGLLGDVQADYWNLPDTEGLTNLRRPVQLTDQGAVLSAQSTADHFLYLSSLAEPDIAGGPDPLKRYFIR